MSEQPEGTISNIPEAFQTESQKDELLLSVINASKDAIVAINQTGQILVFNPAAERMFGRTSEEMAGQQLDLLMPEEYRERHIQYVQCFAQTGQPNRAMNETIELPALRHDGKEFPIELSLSSGACNGDRFFLAIIRDITEKKEAQKRVIHSEKMEAISRLVASIAHIINNDLVKVMGYGSFLENSNEKDEILAAARKMQKLVADLMAYSQHQVLRPGIIDLNTEIGKLIVSILEIIGTNKIKIKINLQEEDLYPVFADPEKIKQVITNLITNSAEAIDEDGEITISTSNVKLTEKSRKKFSDAKPGEYVLLSIQDNGKGMDEQMLEDIFDPFFTTRPIWEQRGMGLSTVWGTVKQHRGYIRVISNPGNGTKVYILLPKHTPKSEIE